MLGGLWTLYAMRCMASLLLRPPHKPIPSQPKPWAKTVRLAQVDIIFALFDVENDGSLACNEFVNVIR